MSELASILEREGRTVDLGPGHYERMLRRRDRRRRNRRIGSAILALVIAAVVIGYAVSVLHEKAEHVPMDRITSQNVADLGLAWTATSGVATGTGGSPSVRDGIVYADVGPTEGTAGIQGFPLACLTSDGSCPPAWSAEAPHTLNDIVLDESFLYVGAGKYHPVVSGLSRYQVDAFARSCTTLRCRPVWKSRTTDVNLAPIAVIGDRLYVRVGAILEAYTRSCGHPVCDPVWSGRAVGPPAFVGDLAIVRTGSGVAAFPAACWTARGPACRRIWTASLDTKVNPTTLPPPVVAEGEVLLDDAAGVRSFPIDCRGTCRADWHGGVPGGPGFEPVVGNGMVFAAADGGSDLYAFPTSCNPSPDGVCAPGWVGHTDEGVGFAPVLSGADVVVASVLGTKLVAFPTSCVDACAPDWVAGLDDSIAEAPTASGDVVFVSGLGTVSAFPSECSDPCQATFRWDLPGGPTQMSPLVDGDAMVVVGSKVMYALRLGSRASAVPTSRSWIQQTGAILFIGAAILVVGGLATRRRRRAFP